MNCFDFGYYWGMYLTVYIIIVFFSSRVPLICLAGLFYFLLRIVADTFNLTVVFKQEMESNGLFA